MCGIFGILSPRFVNKSHLSILASHAKQRGQDSSGIIYVEKDICRIAKADFDICKLLSSTHLPKTHFIAGHSRLVTNGLNDNQPVVRDDIALIHNGIILNEQDIWTSLNIDRKYEIDSEAIIAVAMQARHNGVDFENLASEILAKCRGTVSAVILFVKERKACLFSNNGSLYYGARGEDIYFSSEKYPLEKVGCANIKQLLNSGIVIDIPVADEMYVHLRQKRKHNLIPPLIYSASEEKKLIYRPHNLKRCTKCILPETMPYIKFDSSGICNYCLNYIKRNNPKPTSRLLELLEPYRRHKEADCIIPFSGGRDSCWGLHLAVKELRLKPITYTYDWGMVTDLGRRNISRMCSILGVENIIIAADIEKKRRNIALNLKAWLKSPHLGMVSILTAGDKHFFRHVETVKRQTGISLNMWGVNPLEVTHFKAGFLGIPPDFGESRVYMHGLNKQLDYQSRRFKAMLSSPGYFNRSLLDTLSGEYYRSFTEKVDYYHIFDYWRWDERLCNEVLSQYDWELAPDTTTTWRIGDGTAAFYNYIYYLVAGFTEHDTFRSNQIREGQITRDEALSLVEIENRPRYQNIRWYLDAIRLDFSDVIGAINSIPAYY